MPKIITKPIVGIIASKNIKYLPLLKFIKPTSPAALLHGGAITADSMVEQWAKCYKIECVEYLPVPRLYDYNYNLACEKRNEDIINACDVVIVFYDGKDKEVWLAVEYALSLGRKVILHLVYELD